MCTIGDDIGIAANTPQQLIKNLRAIFQCLLTTGLTFSMAKSHFGVQEVDFLGRTKITKGVSPQKQKIANCSKKSSSHDPKKHFEDALVLELLPKLHT